MKSIPLTRGMVAIVDDADYAVLGGHKWFALAGDRSGCRFVAARTVQDGSRRRTLLMHREILRASRGVEVDHINRNPLDNRRDNLRVATRAQNCANAVKPAGAVPYRGVCMHHGKFRASCEVNGKRHVVGRFGTAMDAARAYDAFARDRHGSFAVLNFPDTQPHSRAA